MSKQNADNKYQTLDFNRGFKIDNPTQFAVSSSSTDALPHSHTFIELMYVKSGTIAHAINFGKPTILKKGDFMLIDTDSVHEYINTDKQPCEIVNLAFTGNFIDRRLTTNSKLASIFRSNKLGLNAVYSPPLEIIMHDEDKSIINTIALIKNEFNRNDELSANILRHLTISILVSMTRIPHGNSNHYMSDIVASMISYIESHYTQKNILQDAATELNYSVAYLSNRFSSEVGVTFKEYLQNYRIDVAKQLLNMSTMSISEVSAAVGYTDCKYFTLLFKKSTNITPREYKEKILKYLPPKKHM